MNSDESLYRTYKRKGLEAVRAMIEKEVKQRVRKCDYVALSITKSDSGYFK